MVSASLLRLLLRRISALVLGAAGALSLATDLQAVTLRTSGIEDESILPGFIVGEISYLWNGDAGFETVPGAKFQNEEALLSVPLPIHQGDSFIVALGLYYRRNHMEFSGFPFLPRDLDLHQLYLPLNVIYDHDDHWSFWFHLAPGLITDFVDVDSDAFDVAARLVALYRVNERLTLVGGLSNSREYGEETVTPIFGSIWNLSPRWRAQLTFPRPSVSFALRKGTVFSLRARPGGGSWSFFNPATNRNHDLDYSSIRVGLSAEQAVGGFGWVFLEGGYQFAQEFEVEGLPPEFDADPGWYFSTGVRLRF